MQFANYKIPLVLQRGSVWSICLGWGFSPFFKEGNTVFQLSRKDSTQMPHLGATVPFRDGAQRKGDISRQLFAILGELELPNGGTSPIPHTCAISPTANTGSMAWLHHVGPGR